MDSDQELFISLFHLKKFKNFDLKISCNDVLDFFEKTKNNNEKKIISLLDISFNLNPAIRDAIALDIVNFENNVVVLFNEKNKNENNNENKTIMMMMMISKILKLLWKW
jgi:hypothetical protein